MMIVGFVCNYPCRMSWEKGERTGLGHLVKEIDSWDVELFQSTRLDVDASKGSSKEVENSLDVSLNQIGICRSDGVRTLLIGQTTYSGGGGVIDNLASELKNASCINFFYCIIYCCLHAQSRALQQSL